MQTAFFRLIQSFFHDFRGNTGNLNVHLQRRNTVFSTRHFEVHVAQVIFVAQDVRQDTVGPVFFQNQTHGNTSYSRFQRYTRIHHGEGPTTDRGHGRGTVGFSDLRHQTNGVREISCRRQNRLKRTPCQLTMTNFTAARATHTTNFTNRIGWEVIVQHEVGFVSAVQRVDHLFVVTGAQCGHNQTLCFTTGEQGGTMGTWQQTGFRHDRADLIQRTTINAAAVFHNVTTQNACFQLLQSRAKVCVFLLFFRQTCDQLLFQSSHSCNTFLLVRNRISRAHFLFACCLNSIVQLRVIRCFELKWFFCSFFRQINDQVDHRLERFMGKFHRTQHLCFGQLICLRFHHHHSVFGTGHNQIKALIRVVAQVLHVINGRVQNIFAVFKTNTCRTDRAHEWRAGNGQCCGSRDHCHHIRVIDQVVGQNGTHHQNFVFETWYEQRADRTVDQAGCQGFFFSRAGFTLEKTAWYFTGGVVFFLIMHSEREEILARLLCFCKGHVRHNRGFAQSGDYGAVSLTCDFACFECERLFAPLHRLFDFVKHHRFLMGSTPGPPGLPL